MIVLKNVMPVVVLWKLHLVGVMLCFAAVIAWIDWLEIFSISIVIKSFGSYLVILLFVVYYFSVAEGLSFLVLNRLASPVVYGWHPLVVFLL